MKKASKKNVVVQAALIACLSSGSVLAADLPSRKAAPYAPPPPPLWTGFYLGINAGGAWSDNNILSTSGYVTHDSDDHVYAPAMAAGAASVLSTGDSGGFIGGAQFGFNWQLTNNLLIGVEVDGQGVAGLNGRADGANIVPVPGNSGNPIYSLTSAYKGLDYLGTVRGRFGYLVTPTLLVYGTGGLAYGGVTANTSIGQAILGSGVPATLGSPSFAGNSFHDTRAGWTAGGGVEWMFLPNWSARIEYLRYDLGSISYGNGSIGFDISRCNCGGSGLAAMGSRTSAHFSGNIVRAGVNYHFGSGGASEVSSTPALADLVRKTSVATWGGFYVGANAGGAWSDENNLLTSAIISNSSNGGGFAPAMAAGATNVLPAGSNGGFIGGGQIGYNLQFSNNLLVGIEIDGQGIAGSNGGANSAALTANPLRANSTYAVATAMSGSSRLDYLGTVRARVGYLVTPSLLLYGTAGLAYGGATANLAISQAVVGQGVNSRVSSLMGSPSISGNNVHDTLVGWAAGGGAEWMFLPGWSAKVEYLRYDLGSMAFGNGASAFSISPCPCAGIGIDGIRSQATTKFNGNIVRAGVNYHFNLGAPVVAND